MRVYCRSRAPILALPVPELTPRAVAPAAHAAVLSERAGVDMKKRARRGTGGEWEECWYLSYWLQVFEGMMEAIQMEGGGSC